MTDVELQTLRNLGNEAETAADEIVRLRALVSAVRRYCSDVQESGTVNEQIVARTVAGIILRGISSEAKP